MLRLQQEQLNTLTQSLASCKIPSSEGRLLVVALLSVDAASNPITMLVIVTRCGFLGRSHLPRRL